MAMEIEVSSDITIAGRPMHFVNQTEGEISSDTIRDDPMMRELAANLSRWVDNAKAAAGRTSMFDRGAFTPPDNPYDEMRSARQAVKYDSIVSGVAEVTEAFAFQGIKWESPNADEADVFNQLSRDMNLDDVVRKMWREEYTYGQFVCAKLWGWQEYTVRGKTTNGNSRKKKYRIWAPLQMRILDSCKVVPVGVGPLGGEGLAWQATQGEIGYYQHSYQGDVLDPLMATFFQGQYEPTYEEAGQLGQLGVDTSRLLVMNPEWVFRHTITKPDYNRFPDIRLKSIFRLLDLKQQLMQSDRVTLIGAANYILLIKKGEKDNPAQAEEIENLRTNYNYIAKLPVIISDHRLNIEIIAPKTDFVLNGDQYQTLDQRILNRLLGTLSSGSRTGGRSETQDTLSATVGRVMENRRHMLKRTLELQVARAIVRHPKNRDVFETEPNLVYTPRNISLGYESGYTQALLALRTQREISRETILEFFGLDEATEAMRVEMEAEVYDDIFKTEIPYTAGSPAEGVDPSLDKKGAGDAGTLQLKVDPKGNITAAPADGKTPAKKTAAPAKKAAPAKAAPAKKTTPNGTPEAPGVSGARGGRPKGGGTSSNSPAKIAKPRTPSGTPKRS